MNAPIPPDSDPRLRLNVRNGSATFLVALASLILANLAPLVMTALGDLGFDAIESGRILTLALFASAAVGLGTAPLAAGPGRRRLAVICLSIATVAFTVAALAPHPHVVAVALILGGAGSGAAISTSGAAIAALRDPNRVAALNGLVDRLLVTVILAAVPIVGVGQLSIFGAAAMTSLVALVLARMLPEAPERLTLFATDNDQPVPSHRVSIAGVSLLILFPLWGSSEDAIWTMAPVLGGAVGLDSDATGVALSLASAGGILGLLLVIIFGHRLGRTVPLAIALALGGVLKVAIGVIESPLLFFALIVGINTVYAFALALFIGTAAGLDSRGRWSGLAGGAYLVGSSCAPLVGSVFIEWFGIPVFSLLMGAVSFAVIIPIVLVARVSLNVERSLIEVATPNAIDVAEISVNAKLPVQGAE